MASYLGALATRGLALNVAQLVGHGTVRAAVKGRAPGPASPDETARMADLVRAALDEGAIGLSTGLGYAPGVFADLDELLGVTAPLARARAASTRRTRAATSRSTIAPRPTSRRPTCWRSTRPPRCGARTASRCSTRT